MSDNRKRTKYICIYIYTAQEATLIDRKMIRNAVTHFYNRIAFCQEAQGFQFEHLH